MLKERKQKEAEFHDRLRSETLKKDKDAFKYLTSNIKFYSITRKSRTFVINWLLQRCRGKKVLDYCCGDGDFSIFLAKNGANATGIDISGTSIENAKRIAISEGVGKNTSFFVMDAENLGFEDNYFDLIICSGILHHLDVKKAYPELARVLKPEGEIICNEPLIHNPFFQLYRKMTPHLRTEWEMHHILSKSDIGLAEKYFDRFETKFFHLATLLAVPFRNLPGFNFILGVFEKVDLILLKLPFLKWWAWQIVFILSEPKKKQIKSI